MEIQTSTFDKLEQSIRNNETKFKEIELKTRKTQQTLEETKMKVSSLQKQEREVLELIATIDQRIRSATDRRQRLQQESDVIIAEADKLAKELRAIDSDTQKERERILAKMQAQMDELDQLREAANSETSDKLIESLNIQITSQKNKNASALQLSIQTGAQEQLDRRLKELQQVKDQLIHQSARLNCFDIDDDDDSENDNDNENEKEQSNNACEENEDDLMPPPKSNRRQMQIRPSAMEKDEQEQDNNEMNCAQGRNDDVLSDQQSHERDNDYQNEMEIDGEMVYEAEQNDMNYSYDSSQ
ncbi:MAG: hypothetical protein EZS28_010163 [Streblomastix strix]|uniref:Uncharacterized protein n=1 Tax=Streblomastix strix TaxID=222440 RepID=A0A5J4WHD0_9EUKA|nr:MAG: hypothetical protein EZS28_010163 [Streblomastix strix]